MVAQVDWQQCWLVDLIRLDHFRGFEAYGRIPFGSPTAADGADGPAVFFAAVKAGVGRFLHREDLAL